MICAHTGCGRYTCQHAKNHYEMTNHSYSLELASGRIWDYDFDTFAHVERGLMFDSLTTSHTTNNNYESKTEQYEHDISKNQFKSLNNNTASSVNNANTSTNISSIEEDNNMNSNTNNLKKSNTWTGKSYQSNLMISNSHSSYMNQSAINNSELGPEVQDKLEILVEKYTYLLESQLEQQQQFYEKRLRRETFQAFYQSLSNSVSHSVNSSNSNSNSHSKNNSSSSNNNNSKNNNCSNNSNSSNNNSNSSSSSLNNNNNNNNNSTNEIESHNSIDMTTTNATNNEIDNFISADTFMINEDDFSTIIKTKSEISATEYEHTQNLEKVKELELKTKKLSKENDLLLRMQQTHQNKMTEIDRLTVQTQAIFENEVYHILLILLLLLLICCCSIVMMLVYYY